MSRVLASVYDPDESPAGDPLEIQDEAGGIVFEFLRGGLDDVPSVRGPNLTYAETPGQRWKAKLDDHMPVTLIGTVFGDPGAGSAQSYLGRMDAVRAVFDPSGPRILLQVFPDAEGVGGGLEAGEVASLVVEFLRIEGPPAFADRYRDFELQCRAVENPPRWVIESES